MVKSKIMRLMTLVEDLLVNLARTSRNVYEHWLINEWYDEDDAKRHHLEVAQERDRIEDEQRD